ncbi:hydroxypyruvate isomerase family protein [Tuwongella immobilis]|uniref:Xylose isomerase-like TIM barrel domain-containing protein n=1 Tax=Tuwongella immobilis TaxID=692036 RepID=A0A6C2YNY6_9BACT|nr:TIM barrel protein [Tuwongella immobilis]VIP02602.1 Hydroxypyruvate isomerase OS=Isosphaera pallida (strain ATCC 43644 / DSM 9630 / IS1B) GN=Isop_2183 PE=4 SV=1: AP_endonuc_2 [Tuwongella immobilis]VTS01894.1 Hydroxypyruvate isomerase OS=Isosphaera pallida (strain ATCC 43644 / DSM 9630 / IS1B) GN=Isop_2183 PE=4 SV=1: AP_endonuc_2 [Tuwongella immobilis]
MMQRREFLAQSLAIPAAILSGSTLLAKDSAPLPGQTKNSKFAVNVEMWWTKLPFIQRIEAAAKMGFSAIELWPWRGKDVNAIHETCQRLKIDIIQFTAWGFKPGLNDPNNHTRFVEEIDASCEIAKKWNCPMMTVVGGDDIPGVSQEKMHEAIITGLKKAAPIAEKHGIMLILEPMNILVDHKGHCLYGSEPATKITRAVNSKMVKLNWDLYHMFITEGNLLPNLKKGFDQVGYLQIADHPGRNEPGTGKINFPELLKGVAELGYHGHIGLELRPKTTELAAALAVQKADNW